MNYIDITYPDINNGNGLRVTFWVAGCPHHCEECHNPQTWSVNNGKCFTKNTQIKLFDILSKDYIDGITLSGGEPLYDTHLNDIFELVTNIKNFYPTKTIWIYSGYTWEQICEDINSIRFNVIKQCDVLVDGKFEKDKKDLSLAWKGSSNQRVIDIQKSLQSGSIQIYKNKYND